MKYSFLLIGTKTDRLWENCLKSAIDDLGRLEIVSEKKAIQTVTKQQFTVIFIDSNQVADVPRLVSQLHAKCPKIHIIVFTASPVWYRAREALQSGAADYLSKTLDKDKLRSEIQSVLKYPPPFGRYSKGKQRWFHGKICYSVC